MTLTSKEYPMLASLEEARVFSVFATGGGYLFIDACDVYFEKKLTREQVLQMAQELIQMAGEPIGEEGDA